MTCNFVKYYFGSIVLVYTIKSQIAGPNSLNFFSKIAAYYAFVLLICSKFKV
jgi:hypothetical protein